MKTSDGIEIVLVAVVGYVVYKFLDKISVVVQPAANVVADIYTAATLPGAVDVKGAAILPNGQAVPMNLITLDKNFQFAYGGRRYKLGARNSSGNWPATLV